MNADQKPLWAFRPIDWKWVGMAYCFFVVFHMLPSYFIVGGASISLRGVDVMPAAWMFLGLAYVGFLVGYRSHGVTITEPGISSLLYALTLLAYMGEFTGQDLSARTVGYVYVTVVTIFVTAVVSAWLGEKAQERMERKSVSSA